jgi:hypothetical protein
MDIFFLPGPSNIEQGFLLPTPQYCRFFVYPATRAPPPHPIVIGIIFHVHRTCVNCGAVLIAIRLLCATKRIPLQRATVSVGEKEFLSCREWPCFCLNRGFLTPRLSLIRGIHCSNKPRPEERSEDEPRSNLPVKPASGKLSMWLRGDFWDHCMSSGGQKKAWGPRSPVRSLRQEISQFSSGLVQYETRRWHICDTYCARLPRHHAQNCSFALE